MQTMHSKQATYAYILWDLYRCNNKREKQTNKNTYWYSEPARVRHIANYSTKADALKLRTSLQKLKRCDIISRTSEGLKAGAWKDETCKKFCAIKDSEETQVIDGERKRTCKKCRACTADVVTPSSSCYSSSAFIFMFQENCSITSMFFSSRLSQGQSRMNCLVSKRRSFNKQINNMLLFIWEEPAAGL